jgi:hypothetical protein
MISNFFSPKRLSTGNCLHNGKISTTSLSDWVTQWLRIPLTLAFSVLSLKKYNRKIPMSRKV